jgi:hypothetical protein
MAMRSDSVYPSSGPAPEQLKLISSVESVSKFGASYRSAAVAFASASLVNVPESRKHGHRGYSCGVIIKLPDEQSSVAKKTSNVYSPSPPKTKRTEEEARILCPAPEDHECHQIESKVCEIADNILVVDIRVTSIAVSAST